MNTPNTPSNLQPAEPPLPQPDPDDPDLEYVQTVSVAEFTSPLDQQPDQQE